MKLNELIKSKKVFMWFLIVVWFVLWWYSFLTIPKEPNPATDLPMYLITTIFPGWDPETVRLQVSNKLENEFKSISNIKKVQASSNYNVSVVIAEFYEAKSKNDALNDLKAWIDAVKWDFPDGVESPTVKQISPNDSPIYTFSVAWNLLNKTLYERTKNLEDNLKSVQWISDVDIIWKPNKNISIEIDYEKLNNYNIDIYNVVTILKSTFIKMPTDKKLISNSLYTYEVSTYNDQDLDTLVWEISNIDIVNTDWKRIKLSDIWNVYYQELVNSKKSYILEFDWKKTDTFNSFNAVSFQLKMTPWQDLSQIIKDIKWVVTTFEKQNSDLKIYETYSEWTEIDEMFWTFVSNFRQSWLLIMLFVLFFVWYRPSIAITIAFPLVYCFVFLILKFLWYSFNSIVSFALVLTLWIMVDNLIVITEWIIEQLKSWEWNYWNWVWKTLNKYLIAIIAWTATTIAMFAPLYNLEWTIWQFIRPLPITIIVTLIVSLFVSSFLLPVILNKFLKNTKWFSKTKWTIFLENQAEKLWKRITKTLTTKIYSFLIVISSWIVLFIWFWLVWVWIVKVDFMPTTDQDNIYLNLKYSPWISLEQNQQYSNEIAWEVVSYFQKNYSWLVEYIWLDLWSTKSTSAIWWAWASWNDNLSNFTIKLLPWDDRKIKSYVIAEEFQKYINTNIKTKYKFINDIYLVSSSSMSWGKAVWFYLVWDNIQKLNEYYLSIKPDLEKIDWMYNISTNIEYTNWKIRYFIDPNKAKEYWISPISWAYLLSALKNSSYVPNWITITNFNEFDKDEIPLKLFVNHSWDINNLKIWNNYFENIIWKKEILPELKSFQSIDWELTLLVEADKYSDIALWEITPKLDEIIKNHPLPSWVEFKYNSNIEEQQTMMLQLVSAFVIWAILMVIVLVLQFNSIKYTMIILTSTILSFIWVLFILPLFWVPLSFPAQLWLFWVIWVWVNNSILYMEAYIEEKEKWINFKKSLVDAVKSRFISIFLTTATTIAWLVTLAMQDALWWALALSFIWWLLVNVFITFYYLPNLLHLIDHKESKN